MYYLLFAIYLGIGTYVITRIPFVKKTGLPAGVIAALFVLKVLAGVAIGWTTLRYNPANDYWILNANGIEEYKIMLNNPHEFFTNIFKSPYDHGYTGFFDSMGSYWNDLRNNIILKLLSVCNIFSRGNYYINSIFFNFFGFFGAVALFRVFSNIYTNKKRAVLAGCFLLPSTLYFSSGIHKDLITFTMMGLFCYGLYFSVLQKLSIKRILLMLGSFTFIFFTRNFVAIALIPAGFAFILSEKKRIHPLATFFVTYGMILLMVLVLELLIPSFQPLKVITQRQADFLALSPATSQLNVSILEPNLKSLVTNLPEAFNHGFLRPFLWDAKSNYFLIPLALELLVYEFLFLFLVFKYRKKINSRNPFILMLLFFSISMLLITGFIIPNIGSIVRYKSIYLPFLLTPLLCAISTEKAKQ